MMHALGNWPYKVGYLILPLTAMKEKIKLLMGLCLQSCRYAVLFVEVIIASSNRNDCQVTRRHFNNEKKKCFGHD